MERSRRDLLNDMAEHRPILKNNQNTYHPRFGSTPKTSIAFPKTLVLFLLWRRRRNTGGERYLLNLLGLHRRLADYRGNFHCATRRSLKSKGGKKNISRAVYGKRGACWNKPGTGLPRYWINNDRASRLGWSGGCGPSCIRPRSIAARFCIFLKFNSHLLKNHSR